MKYAKKIAASMLLLTLAVFAGNAHARSVEVPISARGGEGMFNVFAGLFGDDYRTHVRTVVMAASSLDTGGVAEWLNEDSGNAGKVRIVRTHPVQGGFCRLLFTQVEKGSRIYEYSEYACKTMDSQTWTFYPWR
jgi:surface antigen